MGWGSYPRKWPASLRCSERVLEVTPADKKLLFFFFIISKSFLSSPLLVLICLQFLHQNPSERHRAWWRSFLPPFATNSFQKSPIVHQLVSKDPDSKTQSSLHLLKSTPPWVPWTPLFRRRAAGIPPSGSGRGIAPETHGSSLILLLLLQDHQSLVWVC